MLKIGGMMCKIKTAWREVCSIMGWALCIFIGGSASMLAWIMPLTGMAPSTYLIGCAIASIALAVWIHFSDRQD